MPKKTISGKFEYSPTYDLEKDVLESVELIRNHLMEEVAEIDQIEHRTMQLICMFSLIDSLAQEEANYPSSRQAKDAFCNFVLNYQTTYDYLNEVEPVTLYYRVEDLIEEAPLIKGFPLEKIISLESLGYVHYVMVKELLSSKKSSEILSYLRIKHTEEEVKKFADEHKLISLIYRMRSKAVHEMSNLGEAPIVLEEIEPNEPYYRDVGRIYVQDGNIVDDDVIELAIPNKFIRNILIDCINGYLKNCIDNKRLPFNNARIDRKHILSWYDK